MHAMKREKEFRMTVIIEEKSYQIHLQSTFFGAQKYSRSLVHIKGQVGSSQSHVESNLPNP